MNQINPQQVFDELREQFSSGTVKLPEAAALTHYVSTVLDPQARSVGEVRAVLDGEWRVINRLYHAFTHTEGALPSDLAETPAWATLSEDLFVSLAARLAHLREVLDTVGAVDEMAQRARDENDVAVLDASRLSIQQWDLLAAVLLDTGSTDLQARLCDRIIVQQQRFWSSGVTPSLYPELMASLERRLAHPVEEADTAAAALKVKVARILLTPILLDATGQRELDLVGDHDTVMSAATILYPHLPDAEEQWRLLSWVHRRAHSDPTEVAPQVAPLLEFAVNGGQASRKVLETIRRCAAHFDFSTRDRLAPGLIRLATDATADEETRGQAIQAVIALQRDTQSPELAALVRQELLGEMTGLRYFATHLLTRTALPMPLEVWERAIAEPGPRNPLIPVLVQGYCTFEPAGFAAVIERVDMDQQMKVRLAHQVRGVESEAPSQYLRGVINDRYASTELKRTIVVNYLDGGLNPIDIDAVASALLAPLSSVQGRHDQVAPAEVAFEALSVIKEHWDDVVAALRDDPAKLNAIKAAIVWLSATPLVDRDLQKSADAFLTRVAAANRGPQS